MSNEQKHPKLLCDHRVQVTQTQTNNAHSVESKHSAILEEISVNSATIYTECPMDAGEHVAIDCSTCQLRGKVVGCEARSGGFEAAVELDADSQWSKAQFTPAWLLNPNYVQCENHNCSPECDSPECCGGSKSDLAITL